MARSRIGAHRPPKVIAILLFALVAPLAVGELGVRALIALDRLPEAPSQDEWLEIGLLNARRGAPIDVLLSGDSLTRNDIDPAVLRAHLNAATGESLRIHDMAQLGLDFLNQRLLLEDLERRGRLPRVVVIGVSTSLLRNPDGFVFNLQQMVRSPLGGLLSDCAYMVGLDETLDCRFGQVSALWRWHGRPARIIGAIRRPMPESGRSPGGNSLRRDGFVELPPRTIAQIEADIPQAVADQALHLGPTPESVDAFVALVTFLRDHGVSVVAVTLPYSPLLNRAMLVVNPAWDEERQAAISLYEAAGKLDIIRIDEFGPWWTDGSSGDPKHLSREGAPMFVEQLWANEDFRQALLVALGR